MHFCIGVATGIFFLGETNPESPFFVFLSFFLSLFSSFTPFLFFSRFFLAFLLIYLALFLSLLPFSSFFLASEPQNFSYKDWGSVVSFPSGFWGRTPAKNQISCIRA